MLEMQGLTQRNQRETQKGPGLPPGVAARDPVCAGRRHVGSVAEGETPVVHGERHL